MKPKSSRFEVNKEVRHIFARHSVDTSLVNFQTHGFEVTVGGILWHNDNSDFNAHQLDALIKDFQLTLPTYSLRGETENWTFTSSSMRRVTDVMEVLTDDAGNVIEEVSNETILVGDVSSDED
jgi:hypothetical protein